MEGLGASLRHEPHYDYESSAALRRTLPGHEAQQGEPRQIVGRLV